MASITLVARVVNIRRVNPGSTETPVYEAICEHHYTDSNTGHVQVDQKVHRLPDGFIEAYGDRIKEIVREGTGEFPIGALQDMVSAFMRQQTAVHGGGKKVSVEPPKPSSWGVFA